MISWEVMHRYLNVGELVVMCFLFSPRIEVTKYKSLLSVQSYFTLHWCLQITTVRKNKTTRTLLHLQVEFSAKNYLIPKELIG